MITKDHPLFQKFDALSCDLSPENLTCDGELSRRQVDMRYREIMREWRLLEKQAGFSVSQEEVEIIAIAQYR
jgi:hypothetical protein